MSEVRALPTEEERNAIREGVRAVVTRFDDDYWLERDEDGIFPHEFHRAMADGGWLGIIMPEEYGGAGLGVTEAAIMMHEVASHGGAMAAASTVHINLFGPHPSVVKGTPEQKERWVPRLVSGQDQCPFGFTEPDAGLDTTRIKTFAEKVKGGYVVRRRPGRRARHSAGSGESGSGGRRQRSRREAQWRSRREPGCARGGRRDPDLRRPRNRQRPQHRGTARSGWCRRRSTPSGASTWWSTTPAICATACFIR
jgi:hypothetical protein